MASDTKRGYAVGNVGGSPPAPAVDIDARSTGTKTFGAPKVHDGMHHVADDGQRMTGVSRTATTSALQGFKLPTDPDVQHRGKRFAPVAPHPDTPPRKDRATYDPSAAGRVIGSSIVSGSTKLPEATSEET